MKTSILWATKKIIPVAFWILVWYGIYILVNKEILLASPFEVFSNLLRLSQTQAFWMTALMSLIRILSGFFIGVIVGIVTAVLCALSGTVNSILHPINVVVKSTPVASFIILTLVYMKTWQIPVFASFLMIWPSIWSNVYEGIKKTDIKLLEMGKVFKLSKWKVIKLIYIPSTMGYFISAFTLSIGLAWKAGIAAEVIARPKPSIGAVLNDSKVYMETLDLFSWTIVIIVLSMLLEVFLVKLIKKLTAGINYESK